jgi:hypothetical protein
MTGVRFLFRVTLRRHDLAGSYGKRNPLIGQNQFFSRNSRVRGARRVENAVSRVALPYREPSATEVASVYRLPTISFP